MTGSRSVWALVDTRLQKWEMRPEGWEEMIFEKDISPELLVAVKRHYNISLDESDFQLDLELLDIALDGYVM
jgi:nuclear pore complex protein Nup133